LGASGKYGALQGVVRTIARGWLSWPGIRSSFDATFWSTWQNQLGRYLKINIMVKKVFFSE
jgi:hypothetical protein